MEKLIRSVSLQVYINAQKLLLILLKSSKVLSTLFATKNNNHDLEDRWTKVNFEKLNFYKIDEISKEYNNSDADLNFIKSLGFKSQLVNKKSPVDFSHGPLLFHIINAHPKKYLRIMEIGTAKGFSALCMSKALSNKKKEGIIISNDIIHNQSKRHWNDTEDLNGKVSRDSFIRDNYNDLRSKIMFLSCTSFNLPHIVDLPEIDIWFFDGVHQPKTIYIEFKIALTSCHEDTIFIFDDCTEDYLDYKLQVKKLLKKHKMKYSLISSDSGRKKFYIASQSGFHENIT